MKTLQKIIAILAFLVGAPTAFPQVPSAQVNDISIANYSGSLHAVPGATITVCTSTGSGLPCTPLATIYTNASGTVQAPNPFTADANGNYSFWAPPGNYFVSLTGTVPTWQSITYSIPAQLSTNNNFTGINTSGNFNGILTVDGTQYTTLASAFAACPTSGCTIDMRGNSNATALALGSFDPGNNGPPVIIYLGPFTYTVTTITMRTNLRIFGTGGTTLIEQSSTAPMFQGPPLSTDQPALNVDIEGMVLLGYGFTSCSSGASTGTGDGIYINANQSGALDGLWYSKFTDMTICDFGGIGVHLRGDSNSGYLGINQFDIFNDITVVRSLGGGSAVSIEGANFQISFSHCELDSNYLNSNIDTSATPNVFIGAGPGSGTSGYPYIINFVNGTTIEGAATLVQIDGASNVNFSGMHHEQAYGAYKITYGANGANVPTSGVVVENTSFNGNVGINGGSGYLFDITTTHANGISFANNIYLTSSTMPDNIGIVTSGAWVNQLNWTFEGLGSTPLIAYRETLGSCTLVSGACNLVFTVPYAISPYCTASENDTIAGATVFPLAVDATTTGVQAFSSSTGDGKVANIRCNNAQN
jgi:hypothetical protein